MTDEQGYEMQNELVIEECMNEIVKEFAQIPMCTNPLKHTLSLRNDLGIESLSLISVILRLGEALQIDIGESGLQLHSVETFADLLALGKSLQISKSSKNGE